MPYFHFPHFPFPNNIGYYSYNSNCYKNSPNKQNSSSKTELKSETNTTIEAKKNNSKNNDDCFFELFGLKLYFDDVLLICLIFFLYQEGVKDEELFISLILLLLS